MNRYHDKKRNGLLVATITLALSALILQSCNGEAEPGPSSGQTQEAKPIELSFCGQPGAPVRIEVFSDFQCSYCRNFYFGIIKPLVRDYSAGKKVYVVYHDFPLQMHPHARTASRLALAARRFSQGHWLRVTEALYATQDQWAQNGKFDAVLAKVLDPLEAARVKQLAADPSIEALLQQEISLGNSRQITSTPTYFLVANGGQQRMSRLLDYPVLRSYIDGLLK